MNKHHNRQTLGDLLRRSAARMPGKLAVRCGFMSPDEVIAHFLDGLVVDVEPGLECVKPRAEQHYPRFDALLTMPLMVGMR